MIPMVIVLQQREPVWPDVDQSKVIHLGNGSPAIQVAVLEMGMDSGRPSIAMRLDLPDGRTVVAETSARLFCSAARAIMAKYPGLFDGN